MTELPEGLRLYRRQLIEAIDRERDRRPLRVRWAGPRSLKLIAPACAVAGAVIAAVVLTGGSGVRSADAATLRHVAAALTPASGTILHDRALVTVGGQAPQLYELWQEADSPYAARWIKFGQEMSSDGTSQSVYDAASNTISVNPSGGSEPRNALDLAATLRSLVESGDAHVDGTTTIDGVAAYKLTISNAPRPFLQGNAYVARDTYYPLLIESGTETIKFQTYEYLPATQANLQLLDLAAQHPGARVSTAAK